MGRRPSPHGRSLSRYNRLQHGVMLDRILPSLGPDRCPLHETCVVIQDGEARALCVPGEPCPWEQYVHDGYIRSAKKNYTECLAWLTEAERDAIIAELATLALRRMRLSALTSREGLLRDVAHPISGIVYKREPALGAGRYATAIANRWAKLMDLLHWDPNTEPEDGDDLTA